MINLCTLILDREGINTTTVSYFNLPFEEIGSKVHLKIPCFLDPGSNIGILNNPIFHAIFDNSKILQGSLSGIQSYTEQSMNSNYLEILKPDGTSEIVHVIAGHIPNTLLPSPRLLQILATEVNLKDSRKSTFALFDNNMACPMLLLPIQHCDVQKVPFKEAGIQKPQYSPYLQCYKHTLSDSYILAGQIGIDPQQFPATGYNKLTYQVDSSTKSD